jgi:hypothetical protein
MNPRRELIAAAILLLAGGCAGRGSGLPPLAGGSNGVGVFDASTAACAVSSDGFIWYTVPAGDFPPIDITREQCAASALQNRGTPRVPRWAVPTGPTQTIFVATSLQEKLPLGGMQVLEGIAQTHHVPVTWLAGSSAYLLDVSPYIAGHAQNGDDVEAEPGLESTLETDFAWYRPIVSVQVGGAGRTQRDPAARMPLGEDAFWGIAWNSHGIDELDDLGAPWGSYCADSSSFKRPAPDGSCALLAFEWTARDLTRAYLAGEEAAFSTDPDDLQLRGGFSAKAAQQYIAVLADAYAAAGQTQPLVMVSQQESQEMFNSGDPAIMDALYARVVADGMKTETLAQAAIDARAFSARPRAVAFPFIAGGKNVASPVLSGETIYPATIDYHDASTGMTFIGGHTTPSRVFRYADYPLSTDGVPLPQVPQQQLPALTDVAVSAGTIAFQFNAPVALHYGIALWTDPAALGLSGANVHAAGHAGAVIVFDLQPGVNQISVSCAACTSTTFPYAQ